MFERFLNRETDEEKRRNEERMRIHNAFVNVFGREENRTDDQKIVWSELRKTLGVDRPCFISNEPIAAAINDGIRRAFFVIKNIVEKEKDNG